MPQEDYKSERFSTEPKMDYKKVSFFDNLHRLGKLVEPRTFERLAFFLLFLLKFGINEKVFLYIFELRRGNSSAVEQEKKKRKKEKEEKMERRK